MKTCKTHNIEYEGRRCPQCNSMRARIAYYVRAGRPVPEDVGAYWRPGAACSVCGEPVLTEQEKHPLTSTHRKCGDPHSDVWRRGDPCTKCGLPVECADKHKRFKAHQRCIERQVEETKRKKRIARTAYNKKRWAAQAKPTPKQRNVYVGTQTRQPAMPIIIGDVPVRRIPSLLPPGLRDPKTGTFYSE